MFGYLDVSNDWWENRAILITVILYWILTAAEFDGFWTLESRPVEYKIIMSEVMSSKVLKKWHDLLTHNSLYRHMTNVTSEKCEQYCWEISNLDAEFFISNNLVWVISWHCCTFVFVYLCIFVYLYLPTWCIFDKLCICVFVCLCVCAHFNHLPQD